MKTFTDYIDDLFERAEEEDERDKPDRNIVMQARKAVNMGGKKVTYDDGKTHDMSRGHAQKFLRKHAAADSKTKLSMQTHAQQSHKNFLSHAEEVEVDEKLHGDQDKLDHNKDKKITKSDMQMVRKVGPVKEKENKAVAEEESVKVSPLTYAQTMAEMMKGLIIKEKDTHKTKDGRTAKKGLWYNIHQKRKRGEAPAKPGDPDRPSAADLKRSQ